MSTPKTIREAYRNLCDFLADNARHDPVWHIQQAIACRESADWWRFMSSDLESDRAIELEQRAEWHEQQAVTPNKHGHWRE